MAQINKDGGIAAKAVTAAKMSDIPRKSLTAIPIPGTRKPEFFDATSMDELVAKVPQDFNVTLRHTDGTSAKENIAIHSYEDIELSSIIRKSDTL